ncbi:hypothetical protein [Nocardia sp. NPDC003963]
MPDQTYRAELAAIVERAYMEAIDARPPRVPWESVADALLTAGVRPPRRTTGPKHGCAPGFGRTVTPAEGYFVGFISELPDDSDGEQLMEYSGTVFPTEAEGRAELVEANEWRPKWRLYQMTDITEGAGRA